MSEDTRISKAAPAPNPAEPTAAAAGSPSKSYGGVFSGLFGLANGTAAKLDALWEEVGCSAEERREHLKGAWVRGWNRVGWVGKREGGQRARCLSVKSAVNPLTPFPHSGNDGTATALQGW